MAYHQIKDILEAIRKFHRKIRRELEQAYPDTDDPRSRYLLRSFRRSEQEMDLALGQYEKDGTPPVLETWIQYDNSDDIDEVLRSGKLPPHSSPEEVLDWKQKFDASLAEHYRHLAREVSAARAQELFESLATMIEQRLMDQSWQAREEELAPKDDGGSPH